MNGDLVKLDEYPQLSWSDRVALFAYRLAQGKTAISEDDQFELKHMFRGEWYVREMELPGGFVFVGRPHIQGHIIHLLKGSVTVRFEHATRYFSAPDQLQTIPGFQTVCYAHENVIAQTWHPNPEQCRDVKELEDQYFGSTSAVLQRGEQLAQERLL